MDGTDKKPLVCGDNFDEKEKIFFLWLFYLMFLDFITSTILLGEREKDIWIFQDCAIQSCPDTEGIKKALCVAYY